MGPDVEDHRALVRAGRDVAAGTRGGARHGYRIEGILGSVSVGQPYEWRSHSGKPQRRIQVGLGDFRGIFFELGTLSRRKKKLSPRTLQRRSSGSGQARLARLGAAQGVRPVYALTRALRLTQRKLLGLLERELPG